MKKIVSVVLLLATLVMLLASCIGTSLEKMEETLKEEKYGVEIITAPEEIADAIDDIFKGLSFEGGATRMLVANKILETVCAVEFENTADAKALAESMQEMLESDGFISLITEALTVSRSGSIVIFGTEKAVALVD